VQAFLIANPLDAAGKSTIGPIRFPPGRRAARFRPILAQLSSAAPAKRGKEHITLGGGVLATAHEMCARQLSEERAPCATSLRFEATQRRRRRLGGGIACDVRANSGLRWWPRRQ
jgi:hypothetical protein